ncbi:MAG: AbrB/MazE/SpoVT family DNA-binding domain-containing protein [Candidatus Bipolaricaulia bacterium]
MAETRTIITRKVTRQGQITIPKEIREELGIDVGDNIVFVRQGDRIFIKKLTLEEIMAETNQQYEAGETLSHEEVFRDLT